VGPGSGLAALAGTMAGLARVLGRRGPAMAWEQSHRKQRAGSVILRVVGSRLLHDTGSAQRKSDVGLCGLVGAYPAELTFRFRARLPGELGPYDLSVCLDDCSPLNAELVDDRKTVTGHPS
jgi:hypothetical protein